MKCLPKILLALAAPTLTMGAIVSFSGLKFGPEWTFALPAGMIFLGLFIIAWMMQGEVAKFDAEERAKDNSTDRSRSFSAKFVKEQVEERPLTREAPSAHSN